MEEKLNELLQQNKWILRNCYGRDYTDPEFERQGKIMASRNLKAYTSNVHYRGWYEGQIDLLEYLLSQNG